LQLSADLERDLFLTLTKVVSQLLLRIEGKSVNYLSFNIGSSEKADLERAIAEQKELWQERQALVCTPNSPIGVALIIPKHVEFVRLMHTRTLANNSNRKFENKRAGYKIWATR